MKVVSRSYVILGLMSLLTLSASAVAYYYFEIYPGLERYFCSGLTEHCAEYSGRESLRQHVRAEYGIGLFGAPVPSIRSYVGECAALCEQYNCMSYILFEPFPQILSPDMQYLCTIYAEEELR